MKDSEILHYYENLVDSERLIKNIMVTDDGIQSLAERVQRHTRIVEILKEEVDNRRYPIKELATVDFEGRLITGERYKCWKCGRAIVRTWKCCPWCEAKFKGVF